VHHPPHVVKKAISGGVIEGLNNKVKVTFRKSYGFRTDKARERVSPGKYFARRLTEITSCLQQPQHTLLDWPRSNKLKH